MTNDQQQTTGDFSTHELNGYLRNAGLGQFAADTSQYPNVADLPPDTITALIAVARATLEGAQRYAPPVAEWDITAEKLVLQDDGSPQAQLAQEDFWQAISTVLFAAHALIRLGDTSVLPLIAAMARCLVGHPHELAIEVLRRYDMQP